MRIWLTIAILMVTSLGVNAAPPTELERARIHFESGDAFLSEDFARLEKWSADYRTTRARSSDSGWKLVRLYGGIFGAMRRVEPSEEHFEMLEAKIGRWIKAYPKSPAAWISLSQAYSQHAWFYRGGGYAGTVSNRQWEKFNQLEKQAYDKLQSSKSFASVDPEWYVVTLTLARDQSWPRTAFVSTFDEAVAKEPLYVATYFKAADYLDPKWGGSVEELDGLIRHAVQITQKVEGQALYADIYWYIAPNYKNIFEETPAKWPEMKAGFIDRLKRYPDVGTRNAYARFACLARDRETARSLLAQKDAGISPAYWTTPEELAHCRDWVAGSS
jgi:hypothetical protein